MSNLGVSFSHGSVSLLILFCKSIGYVIFVELTKTYLIEIISSLILHALKKWYEVQMKINDCTTSNKSIISIKYHKPLGNFWLYKCSSQEAQIDER